MVARAARRGLVQRQDRQGHRLNVWKALGHFLDDDRLCMSNNAAERAMRPLATGRRNGTLPDPTKAVVAPPPSTP